MSHDVPRVLPGKPGPTPNPETVPFWEGLADGVIRVQRCRACRRAQHNARIICRWCWSEDLEWLDTIGAGRVWTWTVVHRPSHPAWEDEVPYAVLIVELDEGPRVVTAFEGELPVLSVGLPVVVTSRPQGEGHVVVARAAGP